MIRESGGVSQETLPFYKRPVTYSKQLDKLVWRLMAGMALTVGAIPLFMVNLLGFLFIRARRAGFKFLFFLPGVVCIAAVVHYWITSLV